MAGRVVVVQGEEGGGIEVRNVMFFGHMTRCPVGVVGDGDLVAVRGSKGEQREKGKGDDGGEKVAVHGGVL